MKFGIAKDRSRLGLAPASTLWALSCSLLANVGCSDNNSNNNNGVGGSASSVGGQTSTGGTSVGAGGTRPTGGASNIGGASAMGGSSAVAGSNSTTTGGAGGTTTTGGASATGGSSVLAGASSTGANTGTGGTVATGGTTTNGGANPTGGLSATGGSRPTGGATGNGGTSTVGGTASTGGTSTVAGTNTGGASAIAGTSGGTSAIAGISGGTSTVGGTSTTGGTASAGGAGGSGGEVSAALRNVTLDMTAMTPNVSQMMQFRLVTTATNALRFVGVLDGLPSAAYNFTMPNSVINEAYNLDFFADVNANRAYDAPPTDNAWRQAVPAGLADAVLTFVRNTNYTDVSMPPFAPLGGDFTFQATGMVPHVGQLFELRVIDSSAGRVVGKYVLPAVGSANFSITIPMVIKDLTNYQIDLYADYNGNGKYDAPPADHAWRLLGVGASTGLTVTFAHNTTFTDVGF